MLGAGDPQMRKIAFALAAVCFLGFAGCQKGGNVSLNSDKAKISYAIGQQIGRSVKGSGLDLDSDVIGASIGDALAGRESRLKPEEMQAAMMNAQKSAMEKQQKSSADNVAKGQKFLEENKKKPGVKVTASGLQYEILTPGKG